MARPIIHEQVPLARHTTLGLGGPARFFIECTSDDDIREGIAFAREKDLPILVLGGGSNVVVADEGFPGVVLHLTSHGIAFTSHGDRCSVRVAGGEPWDRVVEACVQQNLGGLECLSGIPGTAGATPVQNVGAYGQEVADAITAVHAIHPENTERGFIYGPGMRVQVPMEPLQGTRRGEDTFLLPWSWSFL